ALPQQGNMPAYYIGVHLQAGRSQHRRLRPPASSAAHASLARIRLLFPSLAPRTVREPIQLTPAPAGLLASSDCPSSCPSSAPEQRHQGRLACFFPAPLGRSLLDVRRPAHLDLALHPGRRRAAALVALERLVDQLARAGRDTHPIVN